MTDVLAKLRVDCKACGHSLDDHTQSKRCKVCRAECNRSSFEKDRMNTPGRREIIEQAKSRVRG